MRVMAEVEVLESETGSAAKLQSPKTESDLVTPQEATELEAQKDSIRFWGKIKGKFGPVLGGIRDWAHDQKLAIALATVFIPSVALACGGGGKEAQVEIITSAPTERPAAARIIQPPPVESIISPTSLSKEATPAATAVPKTPEPIVTPTAASRTPAPTETPFTSEVKPKSEWTIVVDPAVEAKVSRETLDDDKVIIRSVIEKFPQIGNLKIILTSGHRSQFRVETQEVVIGRDFEHFPKAHEGFKWDIAHEVSHYLDPELNGQALAAFLTPEQLSELKRLREVALADPVWGRDYPDLEKIFTPIKNRVDRELLERYPDWTVGLAALTHFYPDAAWMGQRRAAEYQNEEVPRIEVFEPDMREALKAIEAAGQEARDLADFNTIGQFLQKPEVSAKLAPLVAKNPVAVYALELIQKKGQLFDPKNVIWPARAPVPVYLQGKYVSDWWKSLPIYMHMVLAEAYLANDQKLRELLPGRVDRNGIDPKRLEFIQQVERKRIDSALQAIQQMADEEKFAELTAATVLFGAKTPISAIFEQLKEAANF